MSTVCLLRWRIVVQESKCFQFPVFSISGKLVCLVHYSTQEKKKKIFRGNTGPKDTKLRVSSKCALRCAFLFLWHYMFPISLFQIQNEYRQFQRRNNCQLLENMFTCYRYNRCIRKVDIFYKFCRTNEKNGRKIILFLFFKSK